MSGLPELSTARLSLRLARPAMADAMARFLADNWTGHLDRWSPPAGPGWFEPAFWRARLERSEFEWRSGTAARFVVQPLGPESGEVIGSINLTNVVRGPFQACHLGYQIARSHEGQGLMHEALDALVAFAFREMRLHRIMANYVPTNARSAKLLDRLGFVREGLAKDYLFIDGAWRDHVLTAKTFAAFEQDWLDVPGR
ncbi:GNAT family N-acetyltransferase [Usitatibacter palustris]|uniref:GNAT family N-acetyltransferase n=1 Tax=Usitatibacter palustris TaxID=2732487 RepID=UPI001BB29C9C|nr:GNAT family N-acetyltransferase [Usitatibacter palustris]